MPQHDLDIANQGFPGFRSDLNAALVALGTHSSGATEPTTTRAYQPWADVTAGILKIRNAANTGWVSVFNLATGMPVAIATNDITTTGRLTTNAIKEDASGNVGVGGTPAYKLDVRGGVLAVGNGTIFGGISYSTRPEIGSISNHPVGFITNNTTQMLLDVPGNLGLGVVPSAWGSDYKALQIGGSATAALSYKNFQTSLSINLYSTNANDVALVTGNSAKYELNSAGQHVWKSAAVTAGNAITFAQLMNTNSQAITTGANAAASVLVVNRDTTTSRSINASGTINASGADGAEYEYNNGLKIAKGDVVGFKADGTLTMTFTEAVRFGIKSTAPFIVGGDVWGSEAAIGLACPVQPTRKPDETEQRELTPYIAATEDNPAIEATFETVVTVAGDTDEEWTLIEANYQQEKAAFDAALEAARQNVDRIAYFGKVPCNVAGTAGGYIIADNQNGKIVGRFVADPDFAQYKKAVGRVNKALPGGRCEVAVIVH